MTCPRLRPLLALLTLATVASAQSAVSPEGPAAPTPAGIANAPAGAAAVTAEAPADPYEAGVHAFARGDFGGAIRAFDAVLSAPASPERAARAGALRDLAQRYVTTGARLVFPSGNVDAQKNPLALPDERTDDEIVQYYLASVPFGVAVGIYGALLTNANSAAGYVFPILGAVGATAGAMAYADHARTRPFGEPQAIVSGALVGLQVGIPLVQLLDTDGATESLGVGLAATALGGAAGWYANHALGTTPGEMSFVGSTTLWSNALGALTGLMTRARDQDYAGISLASVAVGAAVGARFARDVAPSVAHVRYIDFGALAGGLAIGGSYAAIAGSLSEARTGAGMVALGIVGGASVATYLTRGMAREETRRPMAIHWAPSVAPMPGGATLGIVGSF